MATLPPMRPKSSERSKPSPLATPLGLDLPMGLQGPEMTAAEDDPAVGEWLFKKNDVVLGPVNASVILSRIQADELDGDTPIGREAGQWRPLKEIEYFAAEVERATHRREMEEQRRFAEAKRRKEQGLRTAMYAAAVGIPMLTGFMVGEVLAKKRPWDDRSEWIARLPSLTELPPPPSVAPASSASSAKKKTVSRSRDSEEGQAKEEEDAPVATSNATSNDDKVSKKSSKRKRRSKSARKRLARKSSKPADNAAQNQSASNALPETLTNQQVMAGLAKGKSGIGGCLQKENARNPDMPGVVTLMFTVTEEGKAAMIKVKERQVRDGPLAECLRGVVSKLRWSKFSGERKNAEVPFRIRK